MNLLLQPPVCVPEVMLNGVVMLVLDITESMFPSNPLTECMKVFLKLPDWIDEAISRDFFTYLMYKNEFLVY